MQVKVQSKLQSSLNSTTSRHVVFGVAYSLSCASLHILSHYSDLAFCLQQAYSGHRKLECTLEEFTVATYVILVTLTSFLALQHCRHQNKMMYRHLLFLVLIKTAVSCSSRNTTKVRKLLGIKLLNPTKQYCRWKHFGSYNKE